MRVNIIITNFVLADGLGIGELHIIEYIHATNQYWDHNQNKLCQQMDRALQQKSQ